MAISLGSQAGHLDLSKRKSFGFSWAQIANNAVIES
jgi:hypothetical protein